MFDIVLSNPTPTLPFDIDFGGEAPAAFEDMFIVFMYDEGEFLYFTEESTTYSAYAVNFGTTNGDGWMERDAGLTGAADSTEGTVSVWFEASTIDAVYHYLMLTDGGGTNTIAIDDNDRLRVFLYSAASVQLISNVSAAAIVANTRYHLLYSWKNTSVGGFFHIYLNDVDISNTPTFLANDVAVDWTTTDTGIGDYPGGYHSFRGEMGEFFLAIGTGQSLDLTVEANRRKFRTASGGPVNLGANGSTPTGTQPIIYLKSDYNSFTTNAGSGGNFVKKGSQAFTDGGTF